MGKWPTQKEVLSGASIYGDPRGPGDEASAAWEAANLVNVKAPFTMTFAGKVMIRGCRVHRRCADSLGRVFRALWNAAGEDQAVIDDWGVSLYGGGYTYRLMRGLSTLSMHSYGCAVDLDPARNGLGDQTPRFAQFPAVLKAFADEGWLWGGDWNGNGSSLDERRADGMHWQATA